MIFSEFYYYGSHSFIMHNRKHLYETQYMIAFYKYMTIVNYNLVFCSEISNEKLWNPIEILLLIKIIVQFFFSRQREINLSSNKTSAFLIFFFGDRLCSS